MNTDTLTLLLIVAGALIGYQHWQIRGLKADKEVLTKGFITAMQYAIYLAALGCQELKEGKEPHFSKVFLNLIPEIPRDFPPIAEKIVKGGGKYRIELG